MVADSPNDRNRARNADVTNSVQQSQGNVVQANAVENINLDTQTRPPPHQLPQEDPGFVSRDAELARLDELLAEHPNRGSPVVVSGPDGVGKTALALHWAHQNRKTFPDGDIYLDLGGYGAGTPVHPEEALATLLRSLGDHHNSGVPHLGERSGHYRTQLHNKRMLVLLDNARDVEQIRPLLPGDRASFVLVTSRDNLAGIADDENRITLTTLPDSAPPTSPPVTTSSKVDAPVPADYPYDVFVSYAAEDTDWVNDFVHRLSGCGVAVAHDVLHPGDRRAHTVAQAIMDSKHGLLVFSRAALDDSWIREEYEVLLQRSTDTGQRFIPVVIGEVQLPLFASTRHPCDFRAVSTGGYDHQIDRLLHVLKPTSGS